MTSRSFAEERKCLLDRLESAGSSASSTGATDPSGTTALPLAPQPKAVATLDEDVEPSASRRVSTSRTRALVTDVSDFRRRRHTRAELAVGLEAFLDEVLVAILEDVERQLPVGRRTIPSGNRPSSSSRKIRDGSRSGGALEIERARVIQ